MEFYQQETEKMLGEVIIDDLKIAYKEGKFKLDTFKNSELQKYIEKKYFYPR